MVKKVKSNHTCRYFFPGTDGVYNKLNAPAAFNIRHGVDIISRKVDQG